MGWFSSHVEPGDVRVNHHAGWSANGRVTRVDEDSVYVKYDNSFVEDQLDPDEVIRR